jgi:hypothetical protein
MRKHTFFSPKSCMNQYLTDFPTYNNFSPVCGFNMSLSVQMRKENEHGSTNILEYATFTRESRYIQDSATRQRQDVALDRKKVQALDEQKRTPKHKYLCSHRQRLADHQTRTKGR